MDVLDEQLLQFWKILNENKVRYIMVGGGHQANSTVYYNDQVCGASADRGDTIDIGNCA
jgi:hypothetical protein